MLIVAVRCPTAEGVNVTLIAHCAPGATEVHVVVTANSDGLLLVTLATVTVVAPLLVTVTELGALVVPTVCPAKTSGENIMSWPVPVPLIVNEVETPVPVTVTVPVRFPVAVGLNTTLIVHDELPASTAPQVVPAIVKSALLLFAMARPLAATGPVLLMVAVCCVDAPPTTVAGNPRFAGEACRTGCWAGMTVFVKLPNPPPARHVHDSVKPSVSASSGCTTYETV